MIRVARDAAQTECCRAEREVSLNRTAAGNPATDGAEGLRSIVRALRSRNYRLFFGGQSVSLIGTWMMRVATSWLVYRLTGSAFLLGLTGFVGQIPTFLVAPLAGVLVDRWNRHRILVVTQVLAMVQSLLLAALALGGVIRFWHVLLLSVAQGVINAFDTPARQSLLIDLVERKEDLPNAIALNSSMVNAARLVGPSLAGALIAVAGEGVCFLIDGLSYIAVVAALLAMRIPTRRANGTPGRMLHELAEGMRYAIGFVPIRTILLMLAIVSIVGMPYTVLVPVVARELLGGGPYVFGFLMAATGLGALAGALWLASRRTVLGLGRMLVLAATLFGAGLIAIGLSRWLVITLPLMAVTGFGMMVQIAGSNTLLQTIVDDDKRGRVMSLYTMSFMGMTPFGSLLAGVLAERIGAGGTLIVGGICCLAAAAWFAFRLPRVRALVRPIYVRLGIIPEIASGMQTAATAARQTE